jgi:hypothetical protein
MRDDFNQYLTELGPEKIKAILDSWMKWLSLISRFYSIEVVAKDRLRWY